MTEKVNLLIDPRPDARARASVAARVSGPDLPGVGRDVPSFGAMQQVAEPLAMPGVQVDFLEVYETHFDFVWRSLRLLGVADEGVEDALQDTFSVVSRQLPQFEGRSALRTWLFAILQRVAANHRRTRKRKQAPLEPFEDMASQGPGPDAHAEAVEAARLIELFCAQLEPDRRALFVLAVLEDLPSAEVAETLGLSITQVYSRVHALREGLKRALAERESRHG